LDKKEIKEFETIIFNYIWGNKAELISRGTLYAEYKKGGLNMVCLKAKINMINIRNMIYIKENMHRPQYQYSVYWMKLQLRDYIENYNITPIGMDKDRPKIYCEMIEHLKKYSVKFKNWCKEFNELKKKRLESKNHGKNSIENFTPLDGKVLNNIKFSSKFIYNLCIEDYHTIKKISIETENNEQEKILTRIRKLKSSKVRLTNYKLIHNGLPTNEKFRNKYDYECFMCKRKITESLEHIFVDCEKTKKLYEYIRKDLNKINN
jgi:hypothetical protein